MEIYHQLTDRFVVSDWPTIHPESKGRRYNGYAGL
jgi:hypothetical protein